jgi:hypothetical protein
MAMLGLDRATVRVVIAGFIAAAGRACLGPIVKADVFDVGQQIAPGWADDPFEAPPEVAEAERRRYGQALWVELARIRPVAGLEDWGRRWLADQVAAELAVRPGRGLRERMAEADAAVLAVNHRHWPEAAEIDVAGGQALVGPGVVRALEAAAPGVPGLADVLAAARPAIEPGPHMGPGSIESVTWAEAGEATLERAMAGDVAALAQVADIAAGIVHPSGRFLGPPAADPRKA